MAKNSIFSCFRDSRFAFFFPLFFLLGCRKIPDGHFEGNLITQEEGVQYHQPVHIDILREKPGERSVLIRDSRNRSLYQIHLRKEDRLRVALSFSLLKPEPILLVINPPSKDAEERVCYSSRFEWNIDLCFEKTKFWLDAKQGHTDTRIQIMGYSSKIEAELPLEESKVFSIDELVQRATQSSFNIRKQGELLYQARQRTYAAYLNLLPHFSVNLLWFISPTPSSATNAILSFLPFLLPSQWSLAKSAEIKLQIEKLALEILKADVIASVSSLSTVFLRDQEILKTLQDTQSNIQELVRTVSTGGFDQETQRDFYALNSSLEYAILRTENLLKRDRFELSFALGFHNPNAVKQIQNDSKIYVWDRDIVLDPIELGKLSFSRSFERQQFDLLYQSENWAKLSLAFQWFAPNGDSQNLLGFNLIPQFRTLQSQQSQIHEEREAMQAQLYKSAHETLIDLQEAKDALQENDRQLKIWVEKYSKTTFNLLVPSIKEKLALLTDRINLEAKFDLTQIKISRLLLDEGFKPDTNQRILPQQ